MEHSLLHAIQLIGLIVALGGAFFVLALLAPLQRHFASDPAAVEYCRQISATVTQWVSGGALVAALGTLSDLFVQVAEVRSQTVFGGVDVGLVMKFATHTTVGHLCVARAACLLLTAAAAGLPSARKWPLVAVLAAAAALFTGLVSHAAAQPQARGLAVASQIAHIGAAATWVGVLIHLLANRARIESATTSSAVAVVAELVRRFSPIALTAVVLMLGSGLYAAVRNLVTPGGLLTSAYGLTLGVKLILLIPAVFAGFVNFRLIRPELIRITRAAIARETAAPVLQRFARMLELEVTAGLLVVTVAGIVGSISPPGDDGSLRLTPAQVQALLSPDLPSPSFVDPNSFVGVAGDRPVEDLRYSEFTHNWSGVFVCLLGACWLLPALGAGVGAIAGRVWPLLLLPFAGFIMVFSDPDVWLVPTNSVWSALGDPIIVEHQIGAAMVLLMAWLGWRDRHRPERERPLGYALPVIMIVGSVLLLGHAHSSLRVSDELTNLINVQHAILGALGLIAGTTRWLSLRGLLPPGPARIVWPALVVGIGMFMAFCYREIV
ncbi:MAG TPA: CopD family protein [Candidatus Binatia bacterium]|nr:CopD family protein [Candidatus Binatia bacterium]